MLCSFLKAHPTVSAFFVSTAIPLRHELSRTIQQQYTTLRYPSRHPRGRFSRSQSCVRPLSNKNVTCVGHIYHIPQTQLGGRQYYHGLTSATLPSGPFPRSSSALGPSACKTMIPRRSGSQSSRLPPFIRSIPFHIFVLRLRFTHYLSFFFFSFVCIQL